MSDEQFIRLKSGTVYRYSDALFKRKDAVIVTGQEAADFFRSVKTENDITKKYPPKETVVAKTKAKRGGTGGRKPRTVVSNTTTDIDAIMESLENGSNIRGPDKPGP